MSIETDAPVARDANIVALPQTLSKYDKNEIFQNEMIALHEESIKSGRTPPLDEVVCALVLDQDNTKTRTWAVKNKVCKASEFDKAVRIARIKEEFGRVPQTASEMLEIVAKNDGMKPDFQGLIHRDVPKFVEIDGRRMPYDEKDIDGAWMEASLKMRFKTRLTMSEIALELRLKRDQFKLGFTDGAINDALQSWAARVRQEIFADIGVSIGASALNKPTERDIAETDAAWMQIAKRVFDLSEHSAEYVVAVHKKFVWQIKRKMRDQQVTNHLMPVYLGPQGAGKSTFIRRLIGPVKDLVADTDFDMIEDNRNIDLWKNYVLFLDEMGFASKSDVDVIKHAITAETLARRPMGTNRLEIVTQNATFIGASNKELAQLIKDPTGLRRFAGLRFLAQPDWEFINGVDFRKLWAAIDQMGEDPVAPFRQEMAQLQEQDRELGRVERWLAESDVQAIVRAHTVGQNNRNEVQANQLFKAFEIWEQEFFKGGMPTSLNEFGQEMKRLIKNHPDTTPFGRRRAAKCVMFFYKPPVR